MYRPWVFSETILSAGNPPPYPQLTWSGRGRSLLVRWEMNSAPIQRFDIGFGDALAGLVAIDESTFASTRDYGLPSPDEFDATDFAPLPWSVWKEEDSSRASLYGDLGSITYRKMDSYFFYGGDVVLLIDVADCVPRISVVKEHDELPWQVHVHRMMEPTHENVTGFEKRLGDVAAEFGGRNDGWGSWAQD